MTDKEKLISILQVPIEKLEFKAQKCIAYNSKGKIFECNYVKANDNTIYDIDLSRISETIEWNLIVETETKLIEEQIKTQFNLSSDFFIQILEYPKVSILNESNQVLSQLDLKYNGTQWKIRQTNEFQLQIHQQEIQRLNQQLSISKQNLPYHIQQQNEFIIAFKELGNNWIEQQKQSKQRELEIGNDFNSKELEVVNELDTRDKLFKGTLIGLCLIIMGAGVVFTDNIGQILPIIGVIIGLVLQTDSITKYFTGSSKKKKAENDKYFE